jgi:molybdate transport system substrate-binding protein
MSAILTRRAARAAGSTWRRSSKSWVISGELKPKTRFVSAGAAQGPRVGEAVVRGEAEIGIQPISELMEVEGIDVVGPLPAELQSPDLVYVAGAPFVSEQPIAAKALIDFIADPKAAAVYKVKGLQPG